MDLIEIEEMLSEEAINEICQSGSNDEAVRKWTNYYLYELGQLNICPFACKAMLNEYGFDEVENRMQWIERAIWCAAWNVYDNNYLEGRR